MENITEKKKRRLTTVQNTLFPMIPGTYKGNRGKHSSVYE